MIYVNSIEPLNPETIVETNDRPLIVHCDDFNDYYIKYHKNVGEATRLFNEYLIACLLPVWGFNCSNYALVKVLPEHLPENLGINKRFFNYPCFGIQQIKDCFDLTEQNVEILYKGKNKTKLKADILKLSFFDIFIANEDRHLGNLNTICKFENDEYLLYPIDHIAIFNQLSLKHPLTELSYDETLINSALFSKILNDRDLPRRGILKTLRENFYLCFQDSQKRLDNIIEEMPLEWGISKPQIKQKLLDLCFNDDWFNHCWAKFTEYLQMFHIK